ncbi:c-type cytochrome [Rhodopseudomonas pseudopalustris]|nr:c-type cytochrome [Rhodopseudomonas pseudopalustris]ABE40963.1 cytochrome c, class I [Rhodopseudomonas palustris BisB5]MBB1091039.1 c-type cytochrome [Rhodopseudomonas palustris]SEO61390.1 cytochrome c [Rhodopseudomonas pseudopalustris]
MVRKLLAIVTITAAAGSLSTGTASAQDAAKGEAVFKQCMTCHRADKNMVGPALGGVVGRKAGTAAGFTYSPLNHNSGEAGLVWTQENIIAYLPDPNAYLKKFLTDKGQADKATGSTKMTFKLANDQQRKDVAAYLATLK